MKEKRLTIIADDLTGAMDSSGYFASRGHSTIVVLDNNSTQDADVMVLSTGSRGDPPSTASMKVNQLVPFIRESLVYKKIDSTLRGNIGPELSALCKGLGATKVIITPAFPAMGRTVKNGILYVHGVPVAETQFACDPVTPVTESNLTLLLQRTTGKTVKSIPLKTIMVGPQSLLDDISKSSEEFFVCDTTEQIHLHTIASTLFLSDQNWLPCGSAGLARELSDFIRKKGQSNTEDETISSDPILLVIGSQNQVSVDQLLRAQEELKILLLKLNVELPLTSQKNVTMLNSLSKEAVALLQSEKLVAVTSAFSTYVPELKNSMAGIVAGLVETITKHVSLQGLFLCGGDTALEVCKRLDIGTIQVQGEVETGVPAGYYFDVRGKRTKVVTKAGGFGKPDAIIKSISYLKRGNFQ